MTLLTEVKADVMNALHKVHGLCMPGPEERLSGKRETASSIES